MSTIQYLRELGQSLWLDSISRQMLDDGRLRRYVDEFGVTGLTSNPTIFDEAIGSGAYDEDIARKSREGKSGEALFTELALADLRRALERRSGSMAGCRWSSRRCWPRTPRGACAPRRAFMKRQPFQTCS